MAKDSPEGWLDFQLKATIRISAIFWQLAIQNLSERFVTVGGAKRCNKIKIKPCNEIKYFFCTKHPDTPVETDDKIVVDNTITTHSHHHTHDDAGDNSTETE